MVELAIEVFGHKELAVGCTVLEGCPAFADCFCCESHLSIDSISSFREIGQEFESQSRSLAY